MLYEVITSLRFYNRALEFNERDEHVHFNIARVHFDKGDKKTRITSYNVCYTKLLRSSASCAVR